jgi:hypothetical protein
MRKEGDGKWKTIKSNYSGTTYKDTTAKNGKKYTYSVKAVLSTSYGKAISSYYANDSKAVTYLKAPTLNEALAVENGINVSWEALSGAKGYTILRKNLDGSTSWSAVGKVGADVTSFVDESADIEAGYVYSVRSEATKNKGSYNRTGIDYVELDKPVAEVKATENNQIKISWNESPYATDCEIYCRTVGGEWVLLDVVDSESLNYLYDLNKYGDYEFCVRAVRKDKIFSEYSDAVSYFQEAKVICSAMPFEDGIVLGWKDHGYDSYNIYRRDSSYDEDLEKLVANVTGNSFKDTTVENDVVYTYRVVGVINGEEKAVSKAVSEIGIKTNYDPPTVPKARVIDGVFTQYWDDYVAYAYNYKYECWEYIEFGKTKEYYEDYLKDNKIKLAYSKKFYSNLSTPIDTTISEKEWFDNKIDYTVKVKNKDITIVCKSLGEKIESICIGNMSSFTDGADSSTTIISLSGSKKYYDLEISISTFEGDRATVKERIYLE